MSYNKNDIIKQYGKAFYNQYKHEIITCSKCYKEIVPLETFCEGCETNREQEVENLYTKWKEIAEDPKNQKSLIITDKAIAEQVIKDGTAQFCVYNFETGNIIYKKIIQDQDGVIYAPIMGEEIIKDVVKLPSEALEYGDDITLENDIKSFISKWLDIPDDILQFAVWNIKRSWVFDRFHTLNYMRALGDTGQGKSRFLDTLGALHYKSIATSGATTPAPIYRVIDKWRGTIIMDEADFKFTDESQDIIKIINCGYEKGKFIMRCDQNDANKINYFDPFCPKILATRRTFQDKAVESRCITQVMHGTKRKDIPINLNEEFWQEAQILRNKLLLWRFQNILKINPNAEPDLNKEELEPRIRQIVSSFYCLFEGNEQQHKIFKDFILKKQEDIIQERQNSFEGELVGALYGLFDEGKNMQELCVSDIIEFAGMTDNRGKPTSPRYLSKYLKILDIETCKPKKHNGKTVKFLDLSNEKLTYLFKRYGYQVTKVTVPMLGGANGNHKHIKKFVALPMYGNLGNSVTENKEKITDFLKTQTGNKADYDTLLKHFSFSEDVLYKYITDMIREGIVFCPENPDTIQLLK